VKEESQIDDMRAALRGDRERAEQARQRSSENVLALIDAPAPEQRAEEAQPQARRGFFARLRGR
jgi:ribose 5-phosphate isomerase RpiB